MSRIDRRRRFSELAEQWRIKRRTHAETVIKRLLTRQQEQQCRLSQVDREDDDRYGLADLWGLLISQVYEVYAAYPTDDGDYEQRSSGLEVRQVTESVWLAYDNSEGFYLVSQDEAQGWALVEKD